MKKSLNLSYKLLIDRPENHHVKVVIKGDFPSDARELEFFMPAWSPGSYLIREYSRHVRALMAYAENGERLNVEQTHKGKWKVYKNFPGVNNKTPKSFELVYEVFCHELTVRTSHVDASHAFIHGPCVFMGVVDYQMPNPTLEVRFPPAWSKISTGLKDISTQREVFLYSAADYDTFIDAPIEIGCHETDGFQVQGIDHELAFYGDFLPHNYQIKKDMKTIVETVVQTMKEIPYEKYTFITHMVPGKYGGLEHLNSTALHFSPLNFNDRKEYLHWLALVAHEYFHTWNVKRIRPMELGPFDYLNEAMTKLLWLAEGLTSFMDELFVLRSGLCSMEEYFEMQKDNWNRLISTPGRFFHSLDESSFNAWIKLYRPDENSANSSVSYYLKGGIVFFFLNVLMREKNSSVDELLDLLWKRYNDDPSKGVTAEEVYAMVEKLAGPEVRDEFKHYNQSTEEIDLNKFSNRMGLEIVWDQPKAPYLGAQATFNGDRVLIKSVVLDSPAMKAGLNADDEILAINGLRILRGEWNDLSKILLIDKSYKWTVSRLNKLVDIEITPGQAPKVIKELLIVDKQRASQVLGIK